MAERDELSLELHFARDLADSDVLARLQRELARLAPRMTAGLDVQAHGRDRDRLRVAPDDPDSLRRAVLARGSHRGATYHALAADGPPPAYARRFGAAQLRSRAPGTAGCRLGVDFDAMVPARPSGDSWLWSNSIRAHVSAQRVEGRHRAEWVEQLAAALAITPDFLWGAAYMNAEFSASNLDTSDGVRAVGRDVRRHLPGVYWLNLFGRPYVDLIGRDTLLSAPGDVRELEGAVLLRPYGQPERWRDALHVKARLREHLGEDVFFDRAQPAGPSRAPDLGLGELPAHRPLQVVTADGERFTPLP